ncbi:hypothetical protein EEL52_12790 [Muribaculaceae bacterium Isolate-113 (HZI)]|nr:hypothetical protein EEL53_13405 [Muribaculaceae bacterium Isolate-114 (HZI)]ROT18812.1 hypothetical protein EEL52_12790 [Muribaculaceae bacterium Isolate-113 (HZI)]
MENSTYLWLNVVLIMDVQMRNTAKFTTVKMEKTVYGGNLSPDDSLFIDRLLAKSGIFNPLLARSRFRESLKPNCSHEKRA